MLKLVGFLYLFKYLFWKSIFIVLNAFTCGLKSFAIELIVDLYLSDKCSLSFLSTKESNSSNSFLGDSFLKQ